MRRVLYFGATLSAFACSFPERTFIPADEFDKMKAAGGTAGSGGSAASGGTGATGAMGGDSGTGGMSSGGSSGAAGVGGEGGAAGNAGNAGTGAAGDGGTAGEGGTGATTAGGMGGSAGNPSGGMGGTAGTTGGTAGTGGSGTTNGLIFSEYVEGSALNKALEIYNAGSQSVSLADCHLDKYLNAGTSAESISFVPANTLAPGEVFVICNAGMTVTSACDQTTSGTSTGISHNGNEVYVLVCLGVIEDSIGQIGSNISSKWGTDPISTLDHTLRRQCSVTMGDTDPYDVYDPAADSWDGYDKDDLTDLGMHCGSGGT
ncbi:MAG: lamin tail domain-containing protein [Polyangiaceae bacterium]